MVVYLSMHFIFGKAMGIEFLQQHFSKCLSKLTIIQQLIFFFTFIICRYFCYIGLGHNQTYEDW